MPEETRTASQEWDEIANIRSIHSSGFAKEAYQLFTREGTFDFDYQHEWARLAISYSMQHVEQKAPLESAPDATGVGLHFMTK